MLQTLTWLSFDLTWNMLIQVGDHAYYSGTSLQLYNLHGLLFHHPPRTAELGRVTLIMDSQHSRSLDRCLPAALCPSSRPSAIAQKPVLSLLTLAETIIPEPGHKAARLGSALSWPYLMKHSLPTGTVITGVCIHLPQWLIRLDYHSQINEGCSSPKCFNPFASCRLQLRRSLFHVSVMEGRGRKWASSDSALTPDEAGMNQLMLVIVAVLWNEIMNHIKATKSWVIILIRNLMQSWFHALYIKLQQQ